MLVESARSLKGTRMLPEDNDKWHSEVKTKVSAILYELQRFWINVELYKCKIVYDRYSTWFQPSRTLCFLGSLAMEKSNQFSSEQPPVKITNSGHFGGTVRFAFHPPSYRRLIPRDWKKGWQGSGAGTGETHVWAFISHRKLIENRWSQLLPPAAASRTEGVEYRSPEGSNPRKLSHLGDTRTRLLREYSRNERVYIRFSPIHSDNLSLSLSFYLVSSRFLPRVSREIT